MFDSHDFPSIVPPSALKPVKARKKKSKSVVFEKVDEEKSEKSLNYKKILNTIIPNNKSEHTAPISSIPIPIRCHTNDQMFFKANVGLSSEIIMLDTGAMGNFISMKRARAAGGSILPLNEYVPLVFANETTSISKNHVVLPVSVAGYTRLVDFLVAEVGEQAIIGIPFLQTVITITDWENHEILVIDKVTNNEYLWTGIGATGPSRPLPLKVLSRHARRVRRPRTTTTSFDSVPDQRHSVVKVVSIKELERYHRMAKVYVVNVDEILATRDDLAEQLDPDANTSDPKFQGQQQHPVVNAVLTEFSEVFEAPTELPPQRPEDLEILLIEGSKPPPVRPLGHTNAYELKLISEALPKLMERGQIRRSKSQYGASVLFIKKSDGTMRLCVDYRGLNNITVRNRTPIPNIADMRSSLQGATLFTKLDLRDGFHNLRIRDEDVPKTAFRTRFGLFEFTVVPFGLTNAPAAFSAMINRIFGDLFDVYVISYLDDIIIFSKSAEDHKRHLTEVFNRMRSHKLFVKLSKCEFMKEEVHFCGHIVGVYGISLDQDKVAAIKQTPKMTCVRDVQHYLGMTVWFQDFVKDYAKITAPLTDLLRKNSKFIWITEHDTAVASLIHAISTAPVLRYFDPNRETVVHTDASDFAIGGWLGQVYDDGVHPVLYFSRKLRPAELNYITHEKELLALVYFLEKHGHYLRGIKFTCNTDHESLKYLQVQEKLSRRQARWIFLLQEFEAIISYLPGPFNTIADFLTRNPSMTPRCSVCRDRAATLRAITRSTTTAQTAAAHYHDEIKQELTADPFAMQLEEWMADRDNLSPDIAAYLRHFSKQNGLWFYEKSRLYIPASLQTATLERFHDTVLAGHQGTSRTFEKISRSHFWPKISQDVRNFVRSCDVCQRNQEPSKKQQGFLHPLPIPTDRFKEISIDFAFYPKTTSGFDCIMIIVDRLTKLLTFVPCHRTDTASTVAQLLLKHWVSQGMGRPEAITSDRDSKFTSDVWRAMCSTWGVQQRMATARHQQTDGQAEIAVRTLKRTARKFASYSHSDWDRYIHFLQFALNDSVSASTGFTPFFLAFGMHPRKFNEDVVDPQAGDLVKLILKNVKKARDAMQGAQDRQAKYYDRKHRAFEHLEVNDYVMLSAEGISWSAYSERPSAALPTMLGPFQVLEIQSDGTNVLLRLPPSMSLVHPVFSRSKVRRYVNGTDEFQDRTVFPRPKPVVSRSGADLYEVESILNKRVRRGQTQYLVKWAGYPLDGPDGASWVGYFPGDVSWNEDLDKIKSFEASLVGKVSIGSNAAIDRACNSVASATVASSAAVDETPISRVSSQLPSL